MSLVSILAVVPILLLFGIGLWAGLLGLLSLIISWDITQEIVGQVVPINEVGLSPSPTQR